jgi:hypothetical protein
LTVNGTSVSLGGSVSAGSLDWQTVIVADGSTSTTGVAGRGYFINTTSAAHTFTLPISATRGDTIAIVDYAQTFATNKLTIARNGHNIQGVANNSQIGTNRASVTLVYVDATKGWVYQDESNVADLQEAIFITATGGTITTSGNFKIHSFTGDGCLVVSSLGNPAAGPSGSNIDYLVVAGGGGGGGRMGGGGGGGGYRTTFPSPGCNAGSFPITATTYPITVGGGGAGGPGGSGSGAQGTTGNNSVFSTITSAGGGGGGAAGCAFQQGKNGGSGGGASETNSVENKPGGTGNTPPVSPPQGNNGGGSGPTFSPSYRSAGGGGAAAVGAVSSGPVSGSGGAGSANSITGSSVSYSGGGGGGGGPDPGTAGSGGAGGGGAGRSGPASPGNGNPGTINTGGGGGGGNTTCVPSIVGGSGGTGIVIIRYKFQ